ncbi:DUF2179 domain-containing protein [Fusibacter sp. JL298sf-3]
MIYLFIVFAKIVEVSLATIRMVLITKGERKIGAFIAFFEVTLWVLLVSSVLDNIMGDPLRIFAYALGFAVGNYMGSLIEEKIGIGLSEMQIIAAESSGKKLAGLLRDKGYAVTVIYGEGRQCKRNVLLMYVPRKKIKTLSNIVKDADNSAVITVSDKKSVYGGFGMLKK